MDRHVDECWNVHKLIGYKKTCNQVQYSLVLIVLNITVDELLNFRMEGSESLVSFSVWVVNSHVCSRRDNVEFGIKNVNAIDNTVKPRKSERNVRLILPHSILAAKIIEKTLDTSLVTTTIQQDSEDSIQNLPSRDFLECTGDDEISVIHGNKVSCELAWEVVLAVKFVQVYVWVGIFGFLQGMGNGTLQVCTNY